ncbi:hypothetical protein BH18ACT6_BH18ACT6_02720 [soil metagenome]
MLAVGATVVAVSTGGERTIPIDEFIVDFFTNSLQAGEMVKEVRVPIPPGRKGGAYMKLHRKVGNYATVGVATHRVRRRRQDLEGRSVSPRSVLTNSRAAEAEAALVGQEPNDDLFDHAGELAAASCERLDKAAHELEMDPAEFRLKNFIKPEQFPYRSPTGFIYDSGDYHTALKLAMEMIDYDGWRQKQAERRDNDPDGKQIGIGIASFTEVVGAGNSREYDIAGLKMFDSAELRVHPTGKAILKLGVKSQGQGHETTFAQIVAEELDIPAGHIKVQEGDTDNPPYGLGTYASRSTPVGGAATAMVARKVREKARQLAAHLLEASADDLEWEPGKFTVKGTDQGVTSKKSPSLPTPTTPRGWRPVSKTSAITTLPT